MGIYRVEHTTPPWTHSDGCSMSVPLRFPHCLAHAVLKVIERTLTGRAAAEPGPVSQVGLQAFGGGIGAPSWVLLISQFRCCCAGPHLSKFIA